jgi:hypothetical protein
MGLFNADKRQSLLAGHVTTITDGNGQRLLSLFATLRLGLALEMGWEEGMLTMVKRHLYSSSVVSGPCTGIHELWREPRDSGSGPRSVSTTLANLLNTAGYRNELSPTGAGSLKQPCLVRGMSLHPSCAHQGISCIRT